MADRVWYLIVAPLNVMLELAHSPNEAREQALKRAGYANKPYLARGWQVRIATKDEKRTYAAQMDAIRRSEPTIRTTKRKTKGARERMT